MDSGQIVHLPRVGSPKREQSSLGTLLLAAQVLLQAPTRTQAPPPGATRTRDLTPCPGKLVPAAAFARPGCASFTATPAARKHVPKEDYRCTMPPCAPVSAENAAAHVTRGQTHLSFGLLALGSGVVGLGWRRERRVRVTYFYYQNCGSSNLPVFARFYVWNGTHMLLAPGGPGGVGVRRVCLGRERAALRACRPFCRVANRADLSSWGDLLVQRSRGPAAVLLGGVVVRVRAHGS